MRKWKENVQSGLARLSVVFCRPPVQVDVIPGTSFFGIPEGHVKQKMGDFNITGESEMEFQFRSFLKTAFITSVLNGQVSRLSSLTRQKFCLRYFSSRRP